MRRYKTPEQLKAWREAYAVKAEQQRIARKEHEKVMQKWADEHYMNGQNVICPDGIVRKPWQPSKHAWETGRALDVGLWK